MHLVTVANAAQIVSFHERVGRLADPEDLAAAFDDLFAQAPTTRPEELARIVRHHTEQVTPPRDEPGEGREERADEARRSSRGLWFAQPNASGMVRMHGVLDPEAAAIVKSAIDPLSAPRPIRDEGNRIVQADPRSPAKRRADALVEIISRGVSAAEGVPVTDQAKVVVLIDHDVLAGQVRGTGMSLSGDVLTPSTVRRLACDAAIIPIVLGAESEPLDLGRERRLVSKGLRLALIARDRGCSFPGCSVPPSWTQAHHVTHWVRGGRTSLLDCTLLCQRHHTYVHRHDLTATVTASGVTWQL